MHIFVTGTISSRSENNTILNHIFFALAYSVNGSTSKLKLQTAHHLLWFNLKLY